MPGVGGGWSVGSSSEHCSTWSLWWLSYSEDNESRLDSDTLDLIPCNRDDCCRPDRSDPSGRWRRLRIPLPRASCPRDLSSLAGSTRTFRQPSAVRRRQSWPNASAAPLGLSPHRAGRLRTLIAPFRAGDFESLCLWPGRARDLHESRRQHRSRDREGSRRYRR
jgi:hypothetical protein